MIKKFTVLIVLIQFIANAQCSITTLLPFEFGNTKLDITLKESHLNLAKDNNNSMEDFAAIANNGWRKYNYLKNDSVYKCVVNIDINPDYCYNGYENHIQLSLVNDRLYRMSTFLRFKPSQYKEMMDKFFEISDGLEEQFPYTQDFYSTNDNDEKIGEGRRFHDLPKEKQSKTKLFCYEVSYRIRYKSVYDKYSKKFISTSDIEYYEIEIYGVNLKGTKLTSQGF